MPQIPSDKAVLTFVRSFNLYIDDTDGPAIDKNRVMAEKYIEKCYRTSPPRLYLSHNNTLRFLERTGSKNSKAYELVEKMRHDSFDFNHGNARPFRLQVWRDGWI